MKIIKNQEILKNFIEKYKINSYFDNKNLNFQLLFYEKNEFLTEADKFIPYIMFVVEGSVALYAIRPDGTQYTITENNSFFLLGDVEFITKSTTLFFAEAITPVKVIALSLKENSEILKNDTCFLNFLLNTFAQKLKYWATNSKIYSVNLEEKLLNHITNFCYENKLSNIEKTATILHCSRRQLQRVLKKLTDENILIKEKKGVYILKNN